MAPRDIHKEEEIEEFASAEKTMVTCVTVMNFLPGRLADSLQGQHCTNGEAVQRNNLTEFCSCKEDYWRMTAFRCGVVKISDCLTCLTYK
jgi:hypothetical protein